MTKPSFALRTALFLVAALVVSVCLAAASPSSRAGDLKSAHLPSFTLFESGQVRPLALSPDGKLLFAVNTPDNRLEVFRIQGHGLEHRASIPVGLEPVAVAARSDGEVWVVNHLSDSISIVELTQGGHSGRVVRTLLVGDEPRDIVFAGPGQRSAPSSPRRTAARTFRSIPSSPPPAWAGRMSGCSTRISSAATLGGTPLTIVTLFTRHAARARGDAGRQHASTPPAFHTGNRTTIDPRDLVPDGGVGRGRRARDRPPTPTARRGRRSGLIVKFNGTHWVDELNRRPGRPVRALLPARQGRLRARRHGQSAGASSPEPPGSSRASAPSSTTMAVNPVNGKVYVANTEANNDDRFEGPGTFAGPQPARPPAREPHHRPRLPAAASRRGISTNTSITTTAARRSRTPRTTESSRFPQRHGGDAAMAGPCTSRRSARRKVGIFATAQLENNTFAPSAANQIQVTGGGPTGLVLDEDAHAALRDDPFRQLDLGRRHPDAGGDRRTSRCTTPEPPSVVDGRRFLYDARLSSSHGDSACASCHVFGDFDSLAWDLGNPDGAVIANPGAVQDPPPRFRAADGQPIFHPMKGPMTTQSLRGMANHGPMHWRGDRTGGNDAPSAQPDSGTFDERRGVQEVQRRLPRPPRAPATDRRRRRWMRSPTSSSRSPIRPTRSGGSTTCSPRASRPGATSSCTTSPISPSWAPARPAMRSIPTRTGSTA